MKKFSAKKRKCLHRKIAYSSMVSSFKPCTRKTEINNFFISYKNNLKYIGQVLKLFCNNYSSGLIFSNLSQLFLWL